MVAGPRVDGGCVGCLQGGAAVARIDATSGDHAKYYAAEKNLTPEELL